MPQNHQLQIIDAPIAAENTSVDYVCKSHCTDDAFMVQNDMSGEPADQSFSSPVIRGKNDKITTKKYNTHPHILPLQHQIVRTVDNCKLLQLLHMA